MGKVELHGELDQYIVQALRMKLEEARKTESQAAFAVHHVGVIAGNILIASNLYQLETIAGGPSFIILR